MKSRIIKNFNRGSVTYDSVAEIQTYSANCLLKKINQLQPRSILELGAGTGLLTKGLHSLFPSAEMTVTDISPNMLTICKQHFINTNKINYLCGDIETSTFHAFDLIMSNMVFHWLENLVNSIKKLKKSLNNNAELIFSLLGNETFKELQDICEQNHIGSVDLFPSCHELKAAFPEFDFFIESKHVIYESLYDFFSSLKKLGGNSVPANYKPMPAGKLRNLFNRYNSELTITYQIIYGYYRNV